MKVDIEDAAIAVRKTIGSIPGLTDGQIEEAVAKAVADMEKAVEDEKDNKAPRKKQKNKFFMINTGIDDLGYLVQAKEGVDSVQLIEKIKKVRTSFNQTKKGQKNPIKKVGVLFEHCTNKCFKDSELKRMSKDLIEVVNMDNTL